MTLNQILINFGKKTHSLISNFRANKLWITILVSSVLFLTISFFSISNYIKVVNEENSNNFKKVANSSEFTNLLNFVSSKISSPYGEINYVIQKSDTIEKILKQFSIQSDEIKLITLNLRKKSYQIFILEES